MIQGRAPGPRSCSKGQGLGAGGWHPWTSAQAQILEVLLLEAWDAVGRISGKPSWDIAKRAQLTLCTCSSFLLGQNLPTVVGSLMTLVPSFYPLADVARVIDPNVLEAALKEEVLHVRGRHFRVETDSLPGPPERIATEVIWSSEIFFADSRIEVDPQYGMDPESSHVNDSIYVEVECYGEEVDEFIRAMHPPKRGRPEKYNWVMIKLHARQVARGWAGSQLKYLEQMRDDIEGMEGEKPDLKTVRRHLVH